MHFLKMQPSGRVDFVTFLGYCIVTTLSAMNMK